MAYSLDDLIDGVQSSRRHFLKHVDGIQEDQLDWKPYPECKNVRETLVHLLCDDRVALKCLQTSEQPDWEKDYAEPERDYECLRAMLAESHAKLVDFLKSRYADTPLDTEVSLWGSPIKLGRAVAYLSAEDFYHAGQIAFIRMATDPAWDYYASVYSE